MPDPAPSAPVAIDRLLIVRLGALGDVIHTLPAAAILRRAFPNAELGWVIEKRWAELLCVAGSTLQGPLSNQRPLIDSVHLVDTKAWRRSLFSRATWHGIARSTREVRARHYQVAVDLQGAIRSAVVARLSGAPAIFGFAHPREAQARMFYTEKFVASGAHIIEQNCSLAIAVSDSGESPEPPAANLPRDMEAEQWCEQLFQQLRLRKFVIMNPGAGWGAKQWPAERYGQLAQGLASDGYKTLVNFGPGEEHLVQSVENASGGAAFSVRCSLGQLIALTRRAALFVGGDTGPLHLAAALNVPVVAIFGPTDPARNGPFGTRRVVLRSSSSITSHKRHRETAPGMLEIEVSQVLSAARQLLQKGVA